MNAEIEIKFCNVNIDDIRARLQKAGAVCEQPMRLMRRVLIEQPEHQTTNSFVRVRDEGNGKVKLAYKRRASNDECANIDNVTEIEVEVSSFEDTVKLLHEAGWPPMSYQETRRETWNLDDAEVVIDEWPWLKPYIEIEAATEEVVRGAAAKLGLAWEDAHFGNIRHLYETEYDFEPGFRGPIDLTEVKFEATLPKQMFLKTR